MSAAGTSIPTPHRRAAVAAGALLIAGVATSLLGTAILGGLLSGEHVLSDIAAHDHRVTAVVVLQLLTALGAAGIAIAFFPVVHTYSPALAIGAVAFRSIEAVFSALTALALLGLVALADAPDPEANRVFADVVLTLRDASNYVFGVILFGIAATMYYTVIYRARLLPRFLVVWGLLGVALIVAAALAALLDGPPYAIEGATAVLAVPIALQEVVLGAWLLTKGFRNPRPSVSPH